MVLEVLLNLQSQLPLMGLTDVNKNIRLINKRMRGSQRESQGTLPNKEDIFKELLRNKVNKANIERDGTKRNWKRRSHGIRPAEGKSLDVY